MNDALLRKLDISHEVLSIVDAIILVMDRSGRIVLFNRAAESMTGYTAEEVEFKTPWDLFIIKEEVDAVRNVFSQLTAGNFPNKYTNYWLTKDNSKRLIDWSNSAILSKSGDVDYIIATGIDVTDKKSAETELKNYINDLETIIAARTEELTKSNAELENLIRIDGLTNIFNRRYFDEVIEKEVERGKRSSRPLSLLICDVDLFKNYNDTYGHLAGDDCLIKIASILNSFFCRSTDFVARYGGEEFVVILPGTELQSAMDIANRLILEIQKCNLRHESSYVSKVVTISLGLATRQPDELVDSASLIKDADKALYRAKENGRNQVQLYFDKH